MRQSLELIAPFPQQERLPSSCSPLSVCQDLCGPLDKQHKEERQKEKEGDTALG